MVRYLTIALLCFFTLPVHASSFEYRDYGDTSCEMDFFHPDELKVDLTASVKGQKFGTYSVGYSPYEENLIRARKALSNAAGQCLKMQDFESSCQQIIDAARSWQEANYLTAMSKFDSENWWEESFQSNEFFVYFIEALSIADEKLDTKIAENRDFSEWLLNALHKNRKYEVSKNNHRTVWVIGAAKTAILTGKKIKLGLNSKSGAELIEWELKFQFAKMKKDGALPYEAIRGRRAVFYTGRELGYLIALLEMGEKIGTGSYDKYAPRLHKAVDFMLDAIDDVEVIYPYAKKMKASPKGNPRNQDYGKNNGEQWGTFSFVKVYASRFPNHANVKRMTDHPIVGRFLTRDSPMTKGFGIDIGCLKP